MRDLTEADKAADAVRQIETAYTHAEITPENRAAHYDELVYLRSTLLKLRDLTDDLDQRIAATFEPGERVTLGTKLYEAKRTARRTRWDKDLMRRVLDSPGPADPETGKLLYSTPVAKLQRVWNHSGSTARIGGLEEMGLDPDEWCETEWKPAKLVEVTK